MTSSLFHEDRTLHLTDDEEAIASRPVIGGGGAQGLLMSFQTCRVGPCTYVVEDPLLDRAYIYAYRYKDGGFQQRLRAFVKAGLRAGWHPPGDEAVAPRPTGGAFGKRR